MRSYLIILPPRGKGKVVVGQIQRRIKEYYSERITVSRATQRLLRSFIDWDILKETSTKGDYIQRKPLDVKKLEVIAWLVEAFSHAHPEDKSVLKMALNEAGLFPFHLSIVAAGQLVRVSERLQVLKHDLDQDLIMLDRVS